jgi:hypothetical protein
MSDDSDSTVTRSSAITRSSTLSYSSDRKKRKRNATPTPSEPDRTNKSHVNYFFRKDAENNEIAYSILCERRLPDNKMPYGYSRKGGSTSNLQTHLRDKHGITKNNYKEYLDEDDKVNI